MKRGPKGGPGVRWRTNLAPTPGRPLDELGTLMAIGQGGVNLCLDGDRLLYRADRERVTPELLAALAAHKRWLVRMLRLERWASGEV